MAKSRQTGDLVSQNNLFVDNANDRIGIGTTNPFTNLDVVGFNTNTFAANNIGVPITVAIGGTDAFDSGTAGAGIAFIGKWSSTNPNLTTMGGIAAVKENKTSGNYGSALVFMSRTQGQGGGADEKMRLSSTGNLGIGTTNPTQKVRVEIDSTETFLTDGVNGATALTGSSSNDGIVAAHLYNRTAGISTSQVGFVLSAGGVTAAQHGIYVQRTGTNIGDLVFRRRTSSGGSSESFVVYADGITSFYNVVSTSQDFYAGRYYYGPKILYHTSGESSPITSYSRNSGIHTGGTYTGYTSIIGRYTDDTVYTFMHAIRDASNVETVKSIISANGRAAFHEYVLAGYTHNSTTSTPTYNHNTGENYFSATGRNASTHSSNTTFSSNAALVSRNTADTLGILYHYLTTSGTNTVDYYTHNLHSDGNAWHYASVLVGRTASSTTGTPTYYYRSGEHGVTVYAGSSSDATYIAGRNVADTTEVFYSEVDNEANIRFTAAGDGYWDGTGDLGAADYAEYFEWVDRNPNCEDRVGKTVVLVDEKIRLATSSDNPALIIGVVSGRPAIVGDSASLGWQGRYKKDEFNRRIYEDVEIYTWTDKGGNEMRTRKDLVPADKEIPENWVLTTTPALSLSEDYDPDMEYIPRSQRPEWDAIGMVGKLTIYKGQPVGDRWIKMKDINEQLEQWLVR